jgi:hypothetical protein
VKITAEIVSVGQRIDFDTGDVINTMDVGLPDGAVINVPITEEDMQRLVFLHTGAITDGLPTRPTTPSPPPEPSDDAEAYADVFKIFGGNGGEEIVKESVIPLEPHRSALAPPPFDTSSGVANPRRTVRTVSKDEAGNPIVAGANVLLEIPIAEGLDEDGVPSA